MARTFKKPKRLNRYERWKMLRKLYQEKGECEHPNDFKDTMGHLVYCGICYKMLMRRDS